MKKMLQTLNWFPGNQTTKNSDNVAKLPNDPLGANPTRITTHDSFARRLVLTCLVIFSTVILNAQTQTVILTSGSSWTVPSNVYSITVECWGGGGGGGRSANAGRACGGGGGGAYAKKNSLTVTPGSSISYSIGTGGAGSSAGSGNPGGDTWFSSTSTVLAKGGSGVSQSSSTGGAGGAASSSVGDVKYSGGKGGNGTGSGCCEGAGGGGGAAGSTGNGNAGPNGSANSGVCLSGNDVFGGGLKVDYGGAGGIGVGSDGSGGGAYGYSAGGGGAKKGCASSTNRNGGNGTQGLIRITYCYAPSATNAGADVAICDGGNTTLSGSATAYSGISQLLLQDFENSLTGWSITNTGTSSASFTWTYGPVSTGKGTANSGNPTLIWANGDNSYTNSSTTLTSPTFSTVGYTSLNLSFRHHYDDYDATDNAYVEVYNGSSWVTVQTYTTDQGSLTSFAAASINLNSYVGISNFAIRFRYTNNDDWYWLIDDITISGNISPAVTYSWSPSTGLSATNIANPVASPSSTQTYTLTTSHNGCSTTSDAVVVTVNPNLPASVSIAASPATTICAGTNVTFTATPSNGGASPSYQWKLNGSNVGTNSATYSNNTLANSDKVTVVMTSNATPCLTGSPATSNEITMTVNPPSVGGTASASQVICPNNPPTALTLVGYTGSIQWQSSPDNSAWTDMSGANATPLTSAQMGGTLSATTYFRAVVTSGACTAANSNVVVVYTNDDDASGNIASVSSERTCIVYDNNWHYFRNDDGDVIAAINSQGENLGEVKMRVDIKTTLINGTYSPQHGDGGLGRNGDCYGLPELSVRRWYTIEPKWQNYENGNTGKATLLRLFLTDDDYSNYILEIVAWDIAHTGQNSYPFCYGTANGIIDLAVSRNEKKDVPVYSATTNGGPNGVAQYELHRDSLSTYRFHTNGGIGGPLPIELLSFTGYNDGAVNQLNWTTGSEVNTNQFEIQRSLDGISWETIGSVAARGAKMVTTDYNFEDTNPLEGNNYYRLKVIDNDASFEYSSIIRINVKGGAAINAITQVFPNPTTGKLNVWVAATQEQAVVFNVSDALGKKVAELPRSLVGGMNKLEFNFNNLASGTYIISYVDVNGNKHYHKFVKD